MGGRGEGEGGGVVYLGGEIVGVDGVGKGGGGCIRGSGDNGCWLRGLRNMRLRVFLL